MRKTAIKGEKIKSLECARTCTQNHVEAFRDDLNQAHEHENYYHQYL